MLEINKSRLDFKNELILTAIIYFGFVFLAEYTHHLTALTDSIIIGIATLVFAGIIFFVLNGTKLFTFTPFKKISSKISKISIVIILLVTIIWLYFFKHVLLDVVTVFAEKPAVMFPVLLTALRAGIFEEFLVRGLLLHAFLVMFKQRKNPILLAGISSALAFGLMHLANLFFMNQNLTATIQQIFFASAVGLLFAAIRITANGLMITVILHFLFDLEPSVRQAGTATSWVGLLIVFVPVIILSIFVLFRLGKNRVIH